MRLHPTILLLIPTTFLTSQTTTAFVPISTTQHRAVVDGDTTTFLTAPFLRYQAPTIPTAITTSSLFQLIKADDIEDLQEYDNQRGGVRLALTNAIKLSGDITTSKKGKETVVEPNKLTRYTKVQEISMTDDNIKSVMSSYGNTIIATGSGREFYGDPGEGVVADIRYAPVEAVKEALQSLSSVSGSQGLVVNFAGGKDAIIGEVLDAAKMMVDGFEEGSLTSKTKVVFNSLTDEVFPLETSSVTVVVTGGEGKSAEKPELSNGVMKSVAAGEIYFQGGKYWTASEDDVNTVNE